MEGDGLSKASDLSSAPMELLLRLLRIDEFSSGAHAVRDESDHGDVRISIGEQWYSEIMPSFHDWSLLGAARVSESEPGGKQLMSHVRAAIVVFSQDCRLPVCHARASLGGDPLCATIKSVDLVPESGGSFLDGIGYSITIINSEVRTRMEFFNPRAKTLVAIQDALIETINRICKVSGDGALKAYLDTLSEYVSH